MDWQINRRVPNIENFVFNRNVNPVDFIDCVCDYPSKMEEQRVSPRSERVCRSGYRQTKVQKERQSSLLRKKNVAQGKVHQWASTCDWAREEKKGCHEVCAKTLAAQERNSSAAIEGTRYKKYFFALRYIIYLIAFIISVQVLEPPAEYLEEDLGPGDRVPPDALYMLQSIRVFGHFEKPVFLKLCKHTEIMNLPAGSPLFKIGDRSKRDRNGYCGRWTGGERENLETPE